MVTQRPRLGVCNLCEAICGLVLTVERDRGPGHRRPRQPRRPAVTRAHLPQGRRPRRRARGPRPVAPPGPAGRRRSWEEIGWDEALDLVARRARAARSTSTAATRSAIYLGNPNVHSLGALTHGVAMVKAFRTRNKFSATSVDQLPHQCVAWQMFGHQLLLPIPDIDRTDVLPGARRQPDGLQRLLMTVPDFPNRLRDLKARGGRMVVLDPRRTETAKVADEHHFVRPGTDAVVLLAMLHVLFAEGLDHSRRRTSTASTPCAAAVAPFTPERAERRQRRAPPTTIRRLARELAAADGRRRLRPDRRVDPGVRLGLPVGGQLPQPADRQPRPRGRRDVHPSPAVDTVGPAAHRARPPRRVAQPGARPAGVRRRAAGRHAGRGDRDARRGPGPRAADGRRQPGAVDARRQAARRGARGLDFMAAVDIYLNETTRHADVDAAADDRAGARPLRPGLPRAGGAQHGPVHPGGLRRSRRARCTTGRSSASSRCAPRPGCREAPLAKRLVAAGPAAAQPDAPRRPAAALRGAGLSMRAAARAPRGRRPRPAAPDACPERLQTQDQRIDLAPDLVLADLARLDARARARTADELLLIGRRHQRDNNSWMHNSPRLTRGRPRHQLLCTPTTSPTAGSSDGARRAGDLAGRRRSTVEVQATDDMMPGVVSPAPTATGTAVAGARLRAAASVPGVSINDLTDPERCSTSAATRRSTAVPVTVAAG